MLTCVENIMLPMDFCNMFKPREREEREREGRDGVYDVVVRNADGVVAAFVGTSKEIRGSLYEEEN